MSDATVTIKFNALPAFLAALPGAINGAQNEAVTDVAVLTQLEAPVGTDPGHAGRVIAGTDLRSNIHPDLHEFLVARVASDAVHSGLVHFGTAKMSPRPFMQAGFDRGKALVERRLKDVVLYTARAAGAR
jgi:hypothetical protein